MSNELKDNLLKKLEPHKRNAWYPIVEDVDGDLLSSKFGGTPYLKEGESWPICQNCNEPLLLFAQINYETAPEKYKGIVKQGDGILQVFYCTNDCDCECCGDEELYTLVRFIPNVEIVLHNQEIKIPFKSEEYFTNKIVGWEERVNYPGWEELDDLGITLTEEEENILSEINSLTGDKLLGYGFWVQWKRDCECPICHQDMVLALQIDCEDNVPYGFADGGCSYTLQCPNHPQEVFFIWDTH